MVKKIQFKQHEMVKFISETIMELRAQRIKEQKEPKFSYITIKASEPIKSYGGTKEEAMKAWQNLDSGVRNALTELSIEPFEVIPHSAYDKLPGRVQIYLQGYLYPFNAKESFFRNNAIAEGQALYQYIPGIKTVMLGEVEICVNRQTGKKVNCKTGLALDGTHEMSGFEVDDSQVVIPSLFAFEGEAKMNTKYFCRPYLVGDAEIPENVKAKVLMYLQRAYSTTTGKDLGVNKKDWYSGKEQTLQALQQKLSDSNDYDVLNLVSNYIKNRTNNQEKAYNSGQWAYMGWK